MKTSASFNLKTGLLLLGLCALPFAGCEKDNTEPNRGNNNQPQKHNVELIFHKDNFQNISVDTIDKYNSDPTVDTIFMIPEPYYQFETWNTRMMKDLVNYLRPRHNVNPDKVFGKGKFSIGSQVAQESPETRRFFEDTLRYKIELHDLTKTR